MILDATVRIITMTETLVMLANEMNIEKGKIVYGYILHKNDIIQSKMILNSPKKPEVTKVSEILIAF